MIDEKEEQRFVMKFLWLKGWGAKRIHEELMSTLGDDSYGPPKSKSGFRSSGMVIYPAKTLHAPDDLSCPWGRNLRRLCISIHLPSPE
jgi:hypothetical protein